MNGYYHTQLKEVITNICNVIGCDKCPDSWDGGCVAIELQNKILDEEYTKDEERTGGFGSNGK